MQVSAVSTTLLLMAEYMGTLAAARCLGRNGVKVIVATSNWLAPARWSKWAARTETCPSFEEGPTAILNWLLQYGSRHPGTVLYPTCDEMAWLIAWGKEPLSQHFKLYSPDIAVVRSVLDKRELYAAAARVGMKVPETRYPESTDLLPATLKELGTCMVKPRTQTFFKEHAKGGVAKTPEQLLDIWTAYRQGTFSPEVEANMPNPAVPMVQQYIRDAADGVYSVSGFITKDGELLIHRGSKKILQMPRQAGIGICFEAFEPDATLVQQVVDLCRNTGYYGVFEVEFLLTGSHYMMIDFNPRYFGQMAFDIARGMDLPQLAHWCATGNESLAKTSAQASNAAKQLRTYQNKLSLQWHLQFGRLFGGINAQQYKLWQRWLADNKQHAADALLSKDDPNPAMMALCELLWHSCRHPRGFWRSMRASQ